MNNLKQFKELLIRKQDLLKCIFGTLLFQIILTALVFTYIYKNPKIFNNTFNRVGVFTSIILLLVLNLFLLYVMINFNISFYQRFGIFIIFSIIQGIFLGASLKYIHESIIISSLVSTIIIFLVFLLIGFIIVYFKYDISWLGIFLFFALLGLIIFQITSFFLPASESRRKIMTTLALIIFSGYILFDTNNILLKYKDKNSDIDCIRGALDYYLDIINIFINYVSRQS